MPRQWTLAVDGFGKIDHAEVRLHPFMMFVGDNNSGKSMLMSLLWGMYALRWDWPVPPLWESPSYRACEDWLHERYAELERNPQYSLTKEDEALLLRWINEHLAHNRGAMAKTLFGDETLAPSHLTLGRLATNERVTLVMQQLLGTEPLLYFTSSAGDESTVSIAIDSKNSRFEVLSELAAFLFRGTMFGPAVFTGGYQPTDPVYLPASRSGFMLLYKDVVRQRSRRADRGVDEGSGLTAPVLHFLDLLAFGLKNASGRFAEEAALLERESYEGNIELRPGDVVNDFQYRHAEGRGPLRMALSSSLVTELAPIVLVLRHLEYLRLLILEEPEAHLHPKLQRVLARVIARLVRKGLWVWVTTHNENFCQQINNFIKIGSHPDRARILQQEGYDEKDYLLVDEVAGYQFVNRGARSQVTELAKTDQGLAMPTFNEELISLQKQTLRLEAEAEKAE